MHSLNGVQNRKRFVAVKAERYTTSKQAVSSYIQRPFCVAKYLLGNPKPFKSAPSRRRLRDGIAEYHKGMLESRCEKNGEADKIPFTVSKNILLRCDCVGVDLLTALTISASPSRTVKKSRYKRTAPPSDLLR